MNNIIHNRQILPKIKEIFGHQVIILLLGARQTGKTYLLRLLEKYLLDTQHISSKHIFFFDLESTDDLLTLETKSANEFAAYIYDKANLKPPAPVYVFVDEIQYLSKPSPFFKLLADHHPYIQLILSGSSSLEIKKIFSDRLTGRKIAFHVQPLSFKEYLDFNEFPYIHLFNELEPLSLLQGNMEPANKLKNFIRDILPAYENFILYGSYPKPSLLLNQNQRETMLKDIRDTYVRKDISDILKIENLVGFNKLLTLLATQAGNLCNLHELSASAALDRNTVERYLFYMQETFILTLVRPYFNNPRQEIIKMPKIYFNDTGIRNVLLNNFQTLDLRPDKGALAENAIFCQLQKLDQEIQFWRSKTKAETDFIINLPNGISAPVEVKYTSFKKPTVPTGLAAFIDHYHPPWAFVATKNYFGQAVKGKTHIFFLPGFCF